MTRWSLAIKKLSPAKKAWKGFITKIQPQLQKLLKNTLPKAIKATTKRLVISLNSFLPSRLRPILKARRQSTNYANINYRYYSHQYYYNKNRNNKNTLQKSFAAIHIDELFDGTTMSTTSTTKNKNNFLRDHNMHAEAGTSAHNSCSSSNNNNNNNNNNIKKGHEDRDMQRSKSIYSVEDAWNAVVAASPQLRCVDERAEEFIFKVKQDMRLQKEKSFEEMLARGAN